MSRLRAALALLAGLIPALALASPAQIRLTAPIAGVALRGGETATISWEADVLPQATEEWEAFLSIDGGRRYAIRITPHLDIDRHSATFTVPNITASNARLLLRFGNERNETEVELPTSFKIEGTFTGAPLWPAAATSASHGEEARRGDGGVVAWIAGGRDGRGSHLVAASVPERMRGAALCGGTERSAQAATIPRAPIAATSNQSQPLTLTTHASLPPQAAPHIFSDVLLVTNRLNI